MKLVGLICAVGALVVEGSMQDQGVVVGDEIVGAHIVGDSREAECLEMGLHHPRIGSHPLQGERRLREPAVELPPAAALGRADEAYRGRNVCSRGALQRVDEGRTALALPGSQLHRLS